MKIECGISFESLVSDEEFVNLIRKDYKASELVIQDLIDHNPEKKDEILLAVRFIHRNELQHKELTKQHVNDLWENITNTVKHKKTRERKKKLLTTSLKVAAVLILAILAVGIYADRNSPLKKMQSVSSENAVIILDDYTTVQLQDQLSVLTYIKEGSEIVLTEVVDNDIKNVIDRQRETKTYHQLIVPYGCRHDIVLSDGSVVKMNSGSKLRYPIVFDDDKREVFLEGEAFFEISKNANRPFYVHTLNTDVKVLGTQFNVSAYADSPETATILEEGLVEVTPKRNLFFNESFRLQAGQACFYNSQNESSDVKSVDVENYIGWKNGWLKFKNEEVSSIIQKITRIYNQKIILDNESLASSKVSGKLILTNDIEPLLIFLTRTLDCSLEKDSIPNYRLKNTN